MKSSKRPTIPTLEHSLIYEIHKVLGILNLIFALAIKLVPKNVANLSYFLIKFIVNDLGILSIYPLTHLTEWVCAMDQNFLNGLSGNQPCFSLKVIYRYTPPSKIKPWFWL